MVTFLVIVVAVGAFLAGWAAAKLRAESPVTADERADAVADGPAAADVLEHHATGVVIAGPSGSIQYRNPAARAFDGTHVGVLVDAAVDARLGSALAGEPSSETLELFGPPKRVIVVSARPLPGERAVAYVDDITGGRLADQVRTDFVANVSHELRTPIGALMVLAETLGDVDDPEVVERIVGRIHGEAERASRTIDDLLQLSRLEAGGERTFAPVALADIVTDAVARVSELARRSGIALTTLDPVDSAGPRAASMIVDGDRPQLSSAIGNVVENAVKYSDPGGSVTVRARRDGAIGEIVVTDDGPGIPREDLGRIFERFYRVDRARSRRTGGTGLGLSIVRHVVENHGGTVTVDSEEGEGSTFVLRLPLADGDESRSRSSDTSEGAA